MYSILQKKNEETFECICCKKEYRKTITDEQAILNPASNYIDIPEGSRICSCCSEFIEAQLQGLAETLLGILKKNNKI